ncbi:MAG: hypothetical protein Kow002_03670 [Anaerolineales bacterium]
MQSKIVTLVAVMALLCLGWPQQVRAQSDLDVSVTGVAIDFGKEITFQARIQSSLPLNEINIFIRDDFDNITRVHTVPVDANGLATFRFENVRNALRPFAMLTFWYEANLPGGETLRSQNFFVRYFDNRYPWQTADGELVRVHWYAGEQDFGQALLNTARLSLSKINELTPRQSAEPLDIYVYATPEDLQGALFLSGEKWVGGHANPKLGVALVAITPGPGQSIEMETLIPHELAHIVLYEHTGDGYDNLPAWLREGVASLSELYPNPDYARALQIASENDSLLPMEELCDGFPLDASSAYLAYAESQSFVRFLRDSFGTSGLLSLISAYSDGLNCEQGAVRALGTSLKALDTNWRESVLGQNVAGVFVRSMLPHLLLLGLFILMPFLGMIQRRLRNDA